MLYHFKFITWEQHLNIFRISSRISERCVIQRESCSKYPAMVWPWQLALLLGPKQSLVSIDTNRRAHIVSTGPIIFKSSPTQCSGSESKSPAIRRRIVRFTAEHDADDCSMTVIVAFGHASHRVGCSAIKPAHCRNGSFQQTVYSL